MKLIAELVFDSLTSLEVGGLRGFSAATRLMLFATESYTIDTQVNVEEDRITLTGQVVTHNHNRVVGMVQLLQVGQVYDQKVLDRFGAFTFAALPPNTYALNFYAGEDEIVIPSFNVSL
jgi:hypothetical protein